MGGLAACSLEQQSQESQVRIQIEPSALRRVVSPHRNARIDTNYLLINVEGPGIPFVEAPGFPCLKLGIGASVLVPSTMIETAKGVATGVPIELWVPAGTNRRVSLYGIDLLSSTQVPLPPVGTSASQYFLSEGAAFGPPFFHAEGFVPDLFVEQSIELMRVSDPTVLSCPSNPSAPPVLASESLRLRNYSPYVPLGAKLSEPDLSGPLKFWQPTALDKWIFRVSGELFNAGTGNLTGISTSLAGPSPSPTPVSLTPWLAATTIPSNARLWFEDRFEIPVGGLVSGIFSHKVSFGTSHAITRRIPFAVSSQVAPILVEWLNQSYSTMTPVAGFANLFALKVSAGSTPALLRPVRSRSVFATSVAPGSIEVVPGQVGQGACSMEGDGSGETELDHLSACWIYFVVLGGDSKSARLELEVAETHSVHTDFRLAQFQVPEPAMAAGAVVSNGPITLAARPTPNALGYIELLSGLSVTGREIIRSEISGEGFHERLSGMNAVSYSLANGKYQVPNYWPLGTTHPENCVTRVSMLVKGGQESQLVYRRETFELPPCQQIGTPTPTPTLPAPTNLTAVIGTSSGTSVALSWSAPTGGNTTAVTYNIYRNGSLIQSGLSTLATWDNSLTPGVQYSYQVVAQRGALTSLPSNSVIVKPIGPFEINGPLVKPASGPNAFSVQWSAAAGASTYEVKYRACSSPNDCSPSWSTAGPIAALTQVITGLSSGSIYQVKVVASNAPAGGVVTSRESPEVEGVPIQAPEVSQIPILNGIQLTRNNPSGSSSFELIYWRGDTRPSPGSSLNFSQSFNYGSTFTLSLDGGQTWSGVVRAINDSGFIESEVWTVYVPIGALSVSAGHNHTCAVRVDGKVKCWGANGNGQLGRPETGSPAPDFVQSKSGAPLRDVTQVASGSQHTCAVVRLDPPNNVVNCWGANNLKQLGRKPGENDNPDRGAVEEVSDLLNVIAISAGENHTCAIVGSADANVVKCWGDNSYGQVGSGVSDPSVSSPHEVILSSMLPLGNVQSISAGVNHTCAVTNSGEVYCWGSNESGQLGQSGSTFSESPFAVLVNTLPGDATSVSSGSSHTCVRSSNGTAKCWGSNGFGKLGAGINESLSTAPLTVHSGAGEPLANVSSVSVGGEHSCALVGGLSGSSGVKCSGRIIDSTNVFTLIMGIEGAIQLSSGANHACAIVGPATSGVVKCWGDNNSFQLGNQGGGSQVAVEVPGI